MSEQEKNKGGRKPYAPTDKEREQVRTMTVAGVQQDIIAEVIGVSEPTLRKYFYQEISTSTAIANARVAASLFRMATDSEKPNVAAAIFWMKCRAQWRDVDTETVGKKERQRQEAEELSNSVFKPLPIPEGVKLN